MFIFSLTLIPAVNPIPENLPIAIVNEDKDVEVPDQGRLNMGETLVENIRQAGNIEGKESTIKWVEIKDRQQVMKDLNHQAYYAAIVIEKILVKNKFL